MDDKNAATCPLCSFSHPDSYYNIQHFELCHPENGDSPFIAKAMSKESQNEDGDLDDEAGAMHASPEADYVNCDCGECILSEEYPSHLDMHVAEAMAFEEVDDTSTKVMSSSTAECKDVPPTTSASSQISNSHLAMDSSQKSSQNVANVPILHSRAPNQRSRYSVNDWLDVLRKPNAFYARVKVAKPRHAAAGRLGVSSALLPQRTLLTWTTET